MEPTKKVADPNRWKPGKYKGKPIDWMVTKTQAGLPQVSVLFEYLQPGTMPGTTESRQLTWFGSFKGGALERTLEVLALLGLRQAPYPAMETGRDGKALDENAEVELVVEHRIKDGGEMRAGISWVNRIGGRGLQSKFEGAEAAEIFAQANQDFLAYMQKEGLQPVKPSTATPGKAPTIADNIASGTGTLSEDDLPF